MLQIFVLICYLVTLTHNNVLFTSFECRTSYILQNVVFGKLFGQNILDNIFPQNMIYFVIVISIFSIDESLSSGVNSVN